MSGTAARVLRVVVGSRWVRIGFGLLAVGLLTYAVIDQWSAVAPRFGQLSVSGIVLSSLAALVAMFAMLKSWQAILAGFGSSVRLLDASRIFFIGQLGKYVPGSVWPIVVQAELGADAGVPRRSSVATLLFIYLLYTATAALVSAVTLPWVSDLVPAWLAVLVALAAVAVMLPSVVNRLLGLGLRILRRAPLRIGVAPIARSFGWAVLMWIAFGLHVVVLCHDLRHPLDGSLVLAGIGAFTLAWIAGFLVIIAPAGGGVRELVLSTLLASHIGHSDALAVALISRLMVTVADLLCALGAGATLGRAKLRQLRQLREHADPAVGDQSAQLP